MTTATTASARGAANRRRGNNFEAALAKYLRQWGASDDRLIGRIAERAVIDPSGCWLWQGRLGHRGYGQIMIGRCRPVAHRAVWELVNGPLPDGLQLDHLCRVRHCVNPNHLEPVTAQENTRRGQSVCAALGKRTHCSQGHEFTPENTRRRSNGGRVCATCTRETSRKRWAARMDPLRPSPAAVNAAKERCLRGHMLQGDNVRLANGRRHCRSCARERMRARRAAA